MKLKWEIKNKINEMPGVGPNPFLPKREQAYCLDEDDNNLVVAHLIPRSEGPYCCYDLKIFDDGVLQKTLEFLDATDARQYCENYFTKRSKHRYPGDAI